VILDDILARTRSDLEQRKARRSLAELDKAIASAPALPVRSLAAALRQPGAVACIAEIKRRSPSAGWIREGADAADIARRYAGGGAAAISVLTDAPFFGGGLDDLRAARGAVAASGTPLLRKDFVIDRYQVAEARLHGADAVLLIVAALDHAALAELLAAAGHYGLEALVEAHDAAEAARAVAAGAAVIGVNNRDLRTFTVDRDLALTLRAEIPRDRVLVAESGIRDAADVARLCAGGVDAMLVGETLMRAPDPGAALRALLAR
jgi:indole-3-glycerol phosphate synthase